MQAASHHGSTPADFEPSLQERLWRRMDQSLRELPEFVEGRHQGLRQKLRCWQIIAGLTAQCLHCAVSLQQIVRRDFAVRMSSSALSQRRAHRQLEPSITVMRHALRPMARQDQHPGCFFAGLRLVGIDGTQFDLLNTPQINAEVAKVTTRRGEAAFARLSASVLVELGTHAPLGVAMAFGALSEKALCQPLGESLPESLLILDRYYGQAPMLQELQRQCEARSSHCQEYTAALFMVLQASQGLMDGAAQAERVRRVRVQIAEAALPPRRSRTCQRKVRRPVDKWPRMMNPSSSSTSRHFAVTTIAWRH